MFQDFGVFLKFFGVFEPGFGLLVIFWAKWTNSHPKRTLGDGYWAKSIFRKKSDFTPPFRKPPIGAPPVFQEALVIFWAERTNSRPKRTLGDDFWAKSLF